MNLEGVGLDSARGPEADREFWVRLGAMAPEW